jgi:hypothetical protein
MPQDWDNFCLALLLLTGHPTNIEDLADNMKVVFMSQNINLCLSLFHFFL